MRVSADHISDCISAHHLVNSNFCDLIAEKIFSTSGSQQDFCRWQLCVCSTQLSSQKIPLQWITDDWMAEMSNGPHQRKHADIDLFSRSEYGHIRRWHSDDDFCISMKGGRDKKKKKPHTVWTHQSQQTFKLINLSFLEGLMLRWFPACIIFNICSLKQHICGLL